MMGAANSKGAVVVVTVSGTHAGANDMLAVTGAANALRRRALLGHA